MSFNPQKVHGIIELIDAIGEIAEEELQKTDENDKETYAFIFGHFHLIAVLSSALHRNPNGGKIGLSFDYNLAKEAYIEARQEFEDKEKSEKEHQISMEEMFPTLFKALDEYFEKKNARNTKSKKNKE